MYNISDSKTVRKRTLKIALKWKKMLCLPAVLTLFLTMASCGARTDQGPASNGTEETADQEYLDQTESGVTAVADFHYMQLPATQSIQMCSHYAINGEWLYLMEDVLFAVEGEEFPDILKRPPGLYISRNRISDGHLDQDYIVLEDSHHIPQLLLADSTGNCYLFQGTVLSAEEEVYSLSKYGTDGELLWYKEYAPGELLNKGRSLVQGTVTEDGRVFLYTYGGDGKVFSFGTEGELENVYHIEELKSLDGIAAGKNGRVYGYCVTMGDPRFTELGTEGKTCVCPLIPLQVYDGYEEGICLRTGDGMWSFDPDTGDVMHLWDWENEYVQINGDYVDRFFSMKGKFIMLCREQESVRTVDIHHQKEPLTFASVELKDSREYPGKQEITLSTSFPGGYLDWIVKLYNRQSKEYKIKTVYEGDESALERQLLQGKAPDLINIGELYIEHLAELGAFEDLTDYYKTSEKISGEDILESVRRACTVKGKEVGVIPAFSIDTMLEKEAWCTKEEWTVWKFLEMGKDNLLFRRYQSPSKALQYCMGIRYGEYFIDWQKRECHFDSEEFQQMLEECSKWETRDSPVGGAGVWFEEGDWMIDDEHNGDISSIWDMVSNTDENYSKRLIGYPGWNGGEFKLIPDVIFAINSASQNKAGAWDFLEYLLSEEFQNSVDWALPVRKDSFETRIHDFSYISLNALKGSYLLGYDLAIPGEDDVALLREMAESAVRDNWGGGNNPIWNIVAYEAMMYFSGDADMEDTVRKIQNRMQIYLDE